MNDKDLIKFILLKKRHPLSFSDFIDFLIFLFPLLISVIGISIIYSLDKQQSKNILFAIGLISIFSGFLLFYFTTKRFKENIFFTIFTNNNQSDIHKIEDILKNNFKIENIKTSKQLNLIQIETQITWFSWGEKIIIILNGTGIFVNGRPNSTSQPFTIFKDAKNISILKKLLT